MSQAQGQRIYIFDDPDSKVRFLETHLEGQDWRATIVVPPAQVANPAQYAATLEATLKERGYTTSITTESDGTVNLNLHHWGKRSDPFVVIKEMGLAHGVHFIWDHLGTNLGKVANSAAHLVTYTVKEPARLLSAIYLVGDIPYIFAGMADSGDILAKGAPFTKRITHSVGKLKQSDRALLSLAGVLTTAQSLIFIRYANTGGELNLKEMREQLRNGMKAGIDPTNVTGWTAPGMHKPMLGPLEDVVRKYPIEIGSGAQLLGRVSMMLGNSIQMRTHFSGAMAAIRNEGLWSLMRSESKADHIVMGKKVVGNGFNLLCGVLSLTGWQLLMKNPHHYDHKVSWSHPLTRLRQEVGDHPERFAGLFNAGASAVGIAAGRLTKNPATLSSESAWLAGDLVMMLAKKDDYGGIAARQEFPLIKATTTFMRELPVALSPSQRDKMINDLSDYLVRRTMEDDPKRKNNPATKEEIASLALKVATGLKANLEADTLPYDRIVAAAGKLVERFPVAVRQQVMESIALGLSTSPGIYAARDELLGSIGAHANMKQEFGHTPLNMSQLSDSIAQLLIAAPAAANSGVAMAVYEAIKPLIQTSPRDIATISQAVERQTAIALNIPEARVRQMTQQMNAQPEQSAAIH